jgi:hypothetical protein
MDFLVKTSTTMILTPLPHSSFVLPMSSVGMHWVNQVSSNYFATSNIALKGSVEEMNELTGIGQVKSMYIFLRACVSALCFSPSPHT